MEIYTIQKAEKAIRKHFNTNPRASISAMYRNLRKDHYLRYYGDYVLFSLIVNTLTDMVVVINEKALSYAVRQSHELKGKSSVFKELIRPQRISIFLSKSPAKSSLRPLRYKLPVKERGGE